jgi:hypothetical protein
MRNNALCTYTALQLCFKLSPKGEREVKRILIWVFMEQNLKGKYIYKKKFLGLMRAYREESNPSIRRNSESSHFVGFH